MPGALHPHRHCEEHLRRSNPDRHCGKILDCFATLAMTKVVRAWPTPSPHVPAPPPVCAAWPWSNRSAAPAGWCRG
ncbi:hypothetical protein XH86_35385 [Bradyrhizobium guangdongense]|uniref:Uncharacterized protein n=1 Tax=Bradyrhizobium guangdongense TaxID=1325090 RepID=A0ABX6UQD9_9BRAD|nr:hypothetical protein X265_35345 [Bradyrhizobium guangdongense]QOZ63427.1 hypothetical protein XH86_35385 [Bradyrhizobium guangdongense]